MGLFLDAARQWDCLANTSYTITVGHRKQMDTIKLIFRCVDFDHLSGIHYADDIDFKLHRNEYRGEKLIPALLSHKLDDSLIEKSINWDAKISDRLTAIVDIQKILESDFKIYRFSGRKLPFYSDISAIYFLYSEQCQNGVFLFLDQENECFYCKSVFRKDARDYCINQTSWTVLKKVKTVNDKDEVIYVYPKYREDGMKK